MEMAKVLIPVEDGYRWVLLLGPPWRAIYIRTHVVSQYVSLKEYSAGLSWETCSYCSLKLTGKDDILKWGRFGKFCMYSFSTRCYNVNIVVYENLIVECNLKASLRNLPLAGLSLSISKIIDIGWYLSLLFFQSLSAEWYWCTKLLIIR